MTLARDDTMPKPTALRPMRPLFDFDATPTRRIAAYREALDNPLLIPLARLGIAIEAMSDNVEFDARLRCVEDGYRVDIVTNFADVGEVTRPGPVRPDAEQAVRDAYRVGRAAMEHVAVWCAKRWGRQGVGDL